MTKQDAFFERSKAVVDLLNDQKNVGVREIEVAASAAHGAARYSTWAFANTTLTVRELEARKAQAIEQFTNGYREMLEEHFADYIANYSTYYPGTPGAFTRKTGKPMP